MARADLEWYAAGSKLFDDWLTRQNQRAIDEANAEAIKGWRHVGYITDEDEQYGRLAAFVHSIRKASDGMDVNACAVDETGAGRPGGDVADMVPGIEVRTRFEAVASGAFQSAGGRYMKVPAEEFDAALDAVQADLDDVVESLASAEDRAVRKLVTARQTISDQALRIADLERKVRDMASEPIRCQSSSPSLSEQVIENWRKELNAARDDLGTAQKANSLLQVELEKAKDIRRLKDERILILSADLAEVELNRRGLTDQRDILQQQVKDMDAAIRRYQDKQARTQKYLDSLRADLGVANARVRQLEMSRTLVYNSTTTPINATRIPQGAQMRVAPDGSIHIGPATALTQDYPICGWIEAKRLRELEQAHQQVRHIRGMFGG